MGRVVGMPNCFVVVFVDVHIQTLMFPPSTPPHRPFPSAASLYKQQRLAVSVKSWIDNRRRWAAEGSAGLSLANQISNLSLELWSVAFPVFCFCFF
jgi:hypothetical protein